MSASISRLLEYFHFEEDLENDQETEDRERLGRETKRMAARAADYLSDSWRYRCRGVVTKWTEKFAVGNNIELPLSTTTHIGSKVYGIVIHVEPLANARKWIRVSDLKEQLEEIILKPTTLPPHRTAVSGKVKGHRFKFMFNHKAHKYRPHFTSEPVFDVIVSRYDPDVWECYDCAKWRRKNQ